MDASSSHHRLTTVDSSGRISLGKTRAGALYDATYEPDGRVILTPMLAIPEREAWLYQNPEALALVKKGLSELSYNANGVEIDLSEFPNEEP